MREGLLANVAYFLQQYLSYNGETQFCIFQLFSQKKREIEIELLQKGKYFKEYIHT